MKVMTYTKAKTKCDEIINKFNNCGDMYKDCSECPLNAMVIYTENDEYVSICYLLILFRENIKEKIDNAF